MRTWSLTVETPPPWVASVTARRHPGRESERESLFLRCGTSLLSLFAERERVF
jgi:hypothetical protein